MNAFLGGIGIYINPPTRVGGGWSFGNAEVTQKKDYRGVYPYIEISKTTD